jgi:hypothetical protein
MRLRNVILSVLAGASLGIGGGYLYRKRRASKAEALRRRAVMERIVAASLIRLAAISNGKIPPAEVYFFVWVVERVSRRQGVECPDFNFEADKGLLFSPALNLILRRMIKAGSLRLDENHLVPQVAELEPCAAELGGDTAAIVGETAAQWIRDFPDEPLVRFGKLFR